MNALAELIEEAGLERAMTIDVFVYLAILPSLAISLVTMVYLYHVRKRDVVLYRFADLRRDVMQLLRERGFDLSRKDYEVLRICLGALDGLIASDRNHGAQFNIGSLAARARRNASTVQKVSMPDADDDDIRVLQARVKCAIAQAFFAYTPYLRSRHLLYFFVQLASLVGLSGSQYLRRLSEQNLSTFDRVELLQQQLPRRIRSEAS